MLNEKNFFRLYTKLAGMTGTAKTEEEEFLSIYNMRVVEIPTNRPVQRIDHNDAVYMTKKEKYRDKPRWEYVEKLAQKFPSIPVYLNGDVKDFLSYDKAVKTAPSTAGVLAAVNFTSHDNCVLVLACATSN